MGTEILRPQDCLSGRIRTSPALFPRRKGCNYGNSYSNNRISSNPSSNPRPSRKQQQQPPARSEKPDHKKRSGQQTEPPASRRWGSDDGRAGRTAIVMEKVTILRRGASLDSKMKNELSLRKGGGDLAAKHVHEPELRSPAITKCDVYAGSAFAVSPEPGSLPLPSFSKKKLVSFDDSATRDLRRLLRLD